MDNEEWIVDDFEAIQKELQQAEINDKETASE